MKKFLVYILLVFMTAASPVALAQRHWEELDSAAMTIDHEAYDTPEITVRDGYIYVTTNKAVTVKIFSILGQLISQKQIKPGTSRTRINSRGIYILKVGTVTKRITI